MWFYSALLASLFSAISVIVSKKLLKNVGATFLTWCTLLVATPIVALYAAREGIPSLNIYFLLGVVGSVIFYTLSKVIGFRAMRMADLSAVYPLVSLGPVFTLFIAMFPPLLETPQPLAILGVLITVFGTYILNIEVVKKGIFQPIKALLKNKASALMLLSVLLDSAVIIFDKLAINNTLPQNTTFALLVENILVIIGLIPILYFRDRHFLKHIKISTKSLVLLGFLNAVTTMLAFSAVGGGSVGLVTAVLKTQLLLVLLFSMLFFKDRPKIQTVVGSLTIVAGVVLIKLGS